MAMMTAFFEPVMDTFIELSEPEYESETDDRDDDPQASDNDN